jgi:hypothetical protein
MHKHCTPLCPEANVCFGASVAQKKGRKKKGMRKNMDDGVLFVPAFPTPDSFRVTFFLPFGLRPFFILLKINKRGV